MKNLHKFLANPPSAEITSLKLTGLKQLEEIFLVEEELVYKYAFVLVYKYAFVCVAGYNLQ